MLVVAEIVGWSIDRKDCKLIVFTSSIASVEFFYTLFGRTLLPDYANGGKNGPQHPSAEDDDKKSPGTYTCVLWTSALNRH
jgi:hypothetical protein